MYNELLLVLTKRKENKCFLYLYALLSQEVFTRSALGTDVREKAYFSLCPFGPFENDPQHCEISRVELGATVLDTGTCVNLECRKLMPKRF